MATTGKEWMGSEQLMRKPRAMNDCRRCDTNEHIIIQQLWSNGGWDIYVVTCRRCGECEPCKIRPPMSMMEVSEQCIDAWNSSNEP